MHMILGMLIEASDRLVPQDIEVIASSDEMPQRDPETLQVVHAYDGALFLGLLDVACRYRWKCDVFVHSLLPALPCFPQANTPEQRMLHVTATRALSLPQSLRTIWSP
jgi:hypothetical protein